jgi:pimeloyl-ACP methyl ester carboxylesterase
MQNILTQHSKDIEYADVGRGNIVVLLHGFGEDRTIWKCQIDFLQKKYRLIVPNLPGTNNSILLQNKSASIDDYAIAISSLMDSIVENSNQKITLLGHSMGGYITLAFAKLFPQKLNGFGLIHSTAFADSVEKKQARFRGIEMLAHYGSYPFLKNTIPNLFSTTYKKNHWQQVQELIERGNNISAAALQQYYLAMMNREDASIVLKNATVPVLFIMGSEDVAAPLNDVLQQCFLPDQSHICILENVGHIGMLEASEEVNNAIEKFMSSLN